MADVIAVPPDGVWTDPDVDGLTVTDEEWRLEVDRYRAFITEATGIVPADLSASDCYRIGNRLEALIEQRRRHDEWDHRLLDRYPDVESLDAILWVARVFRACHVARDAGERRPSAPDRRSRVSPDEE